MIMKKENVERGKPDSRGNPGLFEVSDCMYITARVWGLKSKVRSALLRRTRCRLSSGVCTPYLWRETSGVSEPSVKVRRREERNPPEAKRGLKQ
jgi:hypothetical protein